MQRDPPDARREDVDGSAELARRPERAPRHELENSALMALAGEFAEHRETVMQALGRTVVEVCGAGSAVLAFAPDAGGPPEWNTAVGAVDEAQLAAFISVAAAAATPEDPPAAGPVHSAILYREPQRHFTALQAVSPAIVECLVAPFVLEGRTVGTLWAISHDVARQFDAEDARMLARLARFGSIGWRMATRADQRLRRTTETFVRLVERSPFGIYVVDADFRLRLVSEGSQKVFRNVRPLIDRDFADVLRTIWSEPFASEAIARFRHTLETGEPYHAPAMTERRSDVDNVESYDWKIERITLPDGTHGVVCHFYDLTERQQVEQALRDAKDAAEQADSAKTRFLSTLSHELRTPLTAVIGIGELLETEVLGPVNERQKQQLGRIRSSAWHLVAIIDEILTFTRLDAGKEDLRVGPVDIAEIIRGVAGMLAHEASAKQLELRLTGADQPVILESDAGKVRQIIVNLVGNALKYTDEGSIRIHLEGHDDHVELTVSDTGPGIPLHRREEIFAPFVQLDQSSTRVKGGAGLGLAICRRLSRLLGGDVLVSSAPGDGSRFVLRLPRRMDDLP